MNVKRDRGLAYDTLQMLNALQVKTQICARFGPNCYACPLGKLGVFERFTCLDIDNLIRRLELIYRVVEQ
jgi:hypothetical protein|nr:MAG TPA: hypothetical protein [Caudoviricetes sp.]